MKRYAAFIFGEYRTFQIAQKSWEFLKKFDFDIYVSTWSESIINNPYLDINYEKQVKEEDIKTYLPNANVLISDEKEWDERHYSTNVPTDFRAPDKMIYHFKKCLQLYEENNKPADIIFILRTDINYYLDRMPSISENILYTSGPIEKIQKGEWFINDIFFIGTSKIITKFILSIPTISDKGPHDRISNAIIKNHIKVKQFEGFNNGYPQYIIRPNMIDIYHDLYNQDISIKEFNHRMTLRQKAWYMSCINHF